MMNESLARLGKMVLSHVYLCLNMGEATQLHVYWLMICKIVRLSVSGYPSMLAIQQDFNIVLDGIVNTNVCASVS